MAKQDLKAKTVVELREMATRRGILARKNWKKKDFLKALSSKKKVSAQARNTASALPRLVLPPLPAEYGGDKMVSMPVSPRRIYVYWEVPEDRLAKYKGSLNLKVSYVKTNSFFYTPVSGRLGESFININPESDYTIELGVINVRGEFVNIIQLQSETSEIHTPPSSSPSPSGELKKEMPSSRQPEKAAGAEERALPEEFFEMPEPVSSY